MIGCLSLLMAPPFFCQVEALSITTFNILAAVHRSMPITTSLERLEESAAVPNNNNNNNRRESEQREWWLPRAEGLARFVAEELVRLI